MDSYWHKQASDKPLFPDLLWSRPENRALAGKLLIVGGNLYGFAAPAEAYREALAAGVGQAHIFLPDALQRVVGQTFALGSSAALRGPQESASLSWGGSTPSGSFSQQALLDLLMHADWADGVLFAGDLGHNSETAILLEKFAAAYSGQLTITKDAADYFTGAPQTLLNRQDTALVLSFAQLQRLAGSAHFTRPFTFDMGLVKLVETLHDFTKQHSVKIVIKHLQTIVVASSGEVSTTQLAVDQETWRVRTAAHAAVWWLQNPAKPLAALTTAVYLIAQTEH